MLVLFAVITFVVWTICVPEQGSELFTPVFGAFLGGLFGGDDEEDAVDKFRRTEQLKVDPSQIKSLGAANTLGFRGDQIRRDPKTQIQGSSQIGRGEQFRGGQQQLISALQQQAAGQGPSLAQENLRGAQDRALRQQMAIARSHTGGNTGAALRRAQQGIAEQTEGIAQQSAAAGLAEQAQARNQLGTVLSGARGQDITASTEQARLETSQRIAQGQLSAQEQQFRDKLSAELLAQGMTMDQAINIANAQLEQQANQSNQAALLGLETKFIDRNTGITGGILGGIGAAGAALASDERQKKDIKGVGSDKIKEFLAALKKKKFKYKDENIEGAASGDRFGIMAQDLEKSEIGKTLVSNTPTGKKIDVAQGLGAVLASLSDINKRLGKVGG